MNQKVLGGTMLGFVAGASLGSIFTYFGHRTSESEASIPQTTIVQNGYAQPSKLELTFEDCVGSNSILNQESPNLPESYLLYEGLRYTLTEETAHYEGKVINRLKIYPVELVKPERPAAYLKPVKFEKPGHVEGW